ncbi:ECF-type sigma factor [Marinicella sediminis]|uniref:ECF-type sigma factor n=1 Tax=Marinicella sediminis TaxID=1792834 RepID=A0ABV7JH76_9GAMM|nr:ECF-type sigma factor [Marinicella sediminis]
MQAGDITTLLTRTNDDPEALNQVYSLLYDEIKRIAAYHLKQFHNHQTISPTVVANECYLKLVGQQHIPPEDRKHLLNYLSKVMRRFIIDQIRSKNRDKRKAHIEHITLQHLMGQDDVSIDDLELDQLIDHLFAVDQELAELFQQKLFFGFTFKELSEINQLSERQVIRKWNQAKALILTIIEHHHGSE